MEILKNEVLNYLKVEELPNEELELIDQLIKAAKIYISNAGVIGDFEGNNLYQLAVKLLVAHWYENREVIGKAEKLAFSFDAILTQLIYCYE